MFVRVIPWIFCQQTIVNLWSVCEQKEILSNMCKEKNLKKSLEICVRKVTIKKFVENFASKRWKKILRNSFEQNIQKEIFTQAF